MKIFILTLSDRWGNVVARVVPASDLAASLESVGPDERLFLYNYCVIGGDLQCSI